MRACKERLVGAGSDGGHCGQVRRIYATIAQWQQSRPRDGAPWSRVSRTVLIETGAANIFELSRAWDGPSGRPLGTAVAVGFARPFSRTSNKQTNKAQTNQPTATDEFQALSSAAYGPD